MSEFSYQKIKYYQTTKNENLYIFQLVANITIDSNLTWLDFDYTLTSILKNDQTFHQWDKRNKSSDWQLRGGDNLSFRNSVMIKDTDLRSLGCGNLMMNEMLSLAKTYKPNSSIKISLSHVDCEDENNRIRRNKLYKKFNFELHFDDEKECTGYGALILKDATTYTLDELGFKEIDLADTLDDFSQKYSQCATKNKELQDSLRRSNSSKESIEKFYRKQIKKTSIWRLIAIMSCLGALMLLLRY